MQNENIRLQGTQIFFCWNENMKKNIRMLVTLDDLKRFILNCIVRH